jgi:hypothetical protein
MEKSEEDEKEFAAKVEVEETSDKEEEHVFLTPREGEEEEEEKAEKSQKEYVIIQTILII